jgi:surface protein
MKGTIKFLLLLGVLFGAHAALAAPIVPGSFSTTWNTNGDSDIFINLGACPTSVYWEEIGNAANNGTTTSCNGGTFDQTVTFTGPGEYRVDFSGSFTTIDLGIGFFNPNRAKLLMVEQWGNSVWTDLSGAFTNATNLTVPAADVPDLSSVTSLARMFRNATNFNEPINSWNVSNVTDMAGMFTNAPSFNQDLSSWNVSNVTDMTGMFEGATAFNQDISSWDVSQVTDMGSSGEENCDGSESGMFSDATAFNQPIGGWNVANVQYFCEMFSGASSFNQDISAWDVTNATDLSDMFINATAFNQDLSDWQINTGDILTNMFRDSALSATNYARILIGWAALSPAATTIDLGIVSTTYCDAAESARTTLLGTHLWTITDLGPEVCIGFVGEGAVESTDGKNSATKVGLRQKRLNDLQSAMASSTTSVSQKLTNFVTSLKKFLQYLTTHEEEVKNLSPEESKTVIIVLRDAILELLRWLPGV